MRGRRTRPTATVRDWLRSRLPRNPAEDPYGWVRLSAFLLWVWGAL